MIPDAVRGNGQTPRPMRAATLEQAEFQLHEMVMNALAQRQTYFQQMMDPRRDLDKECGYPSTYAVGADLYRTLYDREPIATRVVQLMPKECWQVLPRVYEDESAKNVTPFEQAWDDLGKQITAEKSWHQDEEGSTVWAELAHADILSGLGSFGIILLGLDDGKDFRDPVEGAISDKYVRDRSGKVKTTTNGAAKIDLRKLSLPTPLPQETHLDSLVANSRTPDSKHWKDGSGRVDKHVPFDPSQALSPAFVRNEKGQHGLIVKNTRGEQITANEFRSVGDMVQGSDAQYMGVQLGISQYPVDKPVDSDLNLTFLRSFSEDLVQIVQYEANVRNPRFGMPVMYRITFNDPRETHSGIGLPIASIYVHWTRVIHLFESPVPGSKTFGVPRMRPVLNPVLDVRKIRGSGAEGYWQSCFPGIALSTHPQLGGEVVIDKDDVKNNIENYMNTLQRWLVLSGMGANTLAPTVTDPTPHINIQIEAICIQLGCPVRVFKGSERGELASSQDDSSWNDRLRHRQNTHITPSLICKFIDRLILLGVLPEPEGYSIEWPDLDSVSLKDKAGIFAQRMTAFSTYASGQVETMLPVRDMLTREAGYDEEEADAIIEANQKAQEEQMTQTMPPAGEEGHPATVKPPQPPGPITLGPGQTMVPHPDNPNAASQKPFTAPGKPAPTIAGPTPPQQPKQPPTKNERYTFDKEDCPKCGASMEGDPYSGECNSCGYKWGKKVTENEEDDDYVENRWVTLPNGAHIEIGEDGEITKGPKIDKDKKGAAAHEGKDIPTATVLPGAGGYEQGSPQEKAYIAGEKVRGAIKEGGKKAAKLAMGFGKKLGKKIAGSETGQRVKDEFKEAGDVVREAAGKVKGFFKSLRKKIGLTKNEFVSFQEAVISGFDHEVYPKARAIVLNIAKKDSTVAAWWYALQDSPTDNSNPEGCNQYTGPGCSVGEGKKSYDFNEKLPDKFPVHKVSEKAFKSALKSLKDQGRLNSDGTISLYHDTTNDKDTIDNILSKGLIPAYQPAPGQDWEAEHSSVATYFHQDVNAARGTDPGVSAEEGVVTIEARVPVTKGFIQRLLPDEDNVGSDAMTSLRDGQALAVVGGVPPQYLRRYTSQRQEPSTDHGVPQGFKITEGHFGAVRITGPDGVKHTVFDGVEGAKKWIQSYLTNQVSNSNPEGCNQYKSCSTGGESKEESGDPQLQSPKPSTPEKIASEPADPIEHLNDALSRKDDRTKYPRDETERVIEKLSKLDAKTLKDIVKKNRQLELYTDKWSKAGMLSGIEKALDLSWQMWERVSA